MSQNLDPVDGVVGADVDKARRPPAVSVRPPNPVATASSAGRARAILRGPAVAAVVVAAVVTGAGIAAANDRLRIVRTEEIAPVELGPTDLVALPDLRAYGDLRVTGDVDVRAVPDAAAAAAETGLDVPDVATLPRGVRGGPTYQVVGELSATFTFSAARAARAADADATLPATPAGLDGAQVGLAAGPGVAAVWSGGTGAPTLVVGRAVAPTAFSSGVPFETVRDHLLALPGLADDVATQLRTFAADRSSVPLPASSDRFTVSTAAIDGLPATVLATRDRAMTAVIWVDDGVVTAVAGALDRDEVLSIARDLR